MQRVRHSKQRDAIKAYLLSTTSHPTAEAVRLFCSRRDIRLLRAFAPGTILCEYPNRRQGKRHRKCQCPSEKLLAFVFLCHKNPPFPVCGFRNRETICISVAGCPAANPLAV